MMLKSREQGSGENSIMRAAYTRKAAYYVDNNLTSQVAVRIGEPLTDSVVTYFTWITVQYYAKSAIPLHFCDLIPGK